MDPLSLTASIVAVLQLTSDAVTYLRDVRDAPKECRERMVEVSNLYTLLLKLDLRLSESNAKDPWYIEVRSLAVKDGPLDQYQQALQHLFAKVKPANGIRRLANTLMWTSIKEDVASILTRMERLKTLVGIALEMDHL